MATKTDYIQLDDLVHSDDDDSDLEISRIHISRRYSRQADGAQRPFIRSACPSPQPSKRSHESQREENADLGVQVDTASLPDDIDAASQQTLFAYPAVEQAFDFSEIEETKETPARFPWKRQYFEYYLFTSVVLYVLGLYIIIMLYEYEKLPDVGPSISILVMHLIFGIVANTLLFCNSLQRMGDSPRIAFGIWSACTVIEVMIIPFFFAPQNLGR